MTLGFPFVSTATVRPVGCPDAEQFELVNVSARMGVIVGDFELALLVSQSVMNWSGPPSIVFGLVSLLATIVHCPVAGVSLSANAELDTARITRTSVRSFTMVLPIRLTSIHPSQVTNATACPLIPITAVSMGSSHNPFVV
jgi:hypothetical protein